MPAQTIELFLQVALRPGITMTELSQRLRISQSSVTRNVYKLSDYSRPGLIGVGLLTIEQHPTSFRKKVLGLTERGRELLASIVRNFETAAEINMHSGERSGWRTAPPPSTT
jgi:DNA-binding MarR family transcriptional regulator